MLPQYYVKLYQNNRGWWGRMVEGIFSAAVLLLVSITILLVIRPISVRYDQPGLLIYTLALLAASMYSLQQALHPPHGDTRRAWYGIVGGMLAWSVALVSSELGVPIMPNMAGIVLLIMVTLIVVLLWKNVLPLGARFFSLTFMLNWIAHVFLSVQAWLAQFSPIFALSLRMIGVLAAVGAVLVAAWILARSNRRIQRVRGALALWFLTSLVLSIFVGFLWV